MPGEFPTAPPPTPAVTAVAATPPAPALPEVAEAPPKAEVPIAPAGGPRASRYIGEMPLPEGGTLSLDGLVSSATNPVAVINGRLLSPGDVVQGFSVVSIGAEHVVLERDGRRFTLTLR